LHHSIARTKWSRKLLHTGLIKQEWLVEIMFESSGRVIKSSLRGEMKTAAAEINGHSRGFF